MKVDPEVERVIKEFHQQRKVIGLCCIAPILAAKVLGKVSASIVLKCTIVVWYRLESYIQ
jgi:enhancing lycopene biosynthesis protein 2